MGAVFVGFLAVCFTLTGCTSEPLEQDYIARLGDSYLYRDELDAALASVPLVSDSAEVKEQFVEQWLATELLYQEAMRRGLRREADVIRLLEDNERSVLINALLSKLYEENEISPSPGELQAYFERHKEQLRLREPYVRIRYLYNEDRDTVQHVHQALSELAETNYDPDSLWQDQLFRVAADAELSLHLSQTYLPENRLFTTQPALKLALEGLTDGEVAPVLEEGPYYHVLQLVERVPANTIPEIRWIEDELTERLIIQSRKLMYARQVQRLRNEAIAREELTIQ